MIKKGKLLHFPIQNVKYKYQVIDLMIVVLLKECN